MKIIEAMLKKNPCYTSGRKISVKGLMLHSVGCPQPDATVFVENWDSVAYDRACVHAFIDGNTGAVYQTLPWNHRGWHAGDSANNSHIGVEMCEPDCITYTSGARFTCSNVTKAKAVAKRTYEAAVELFAYLCGEYGLNPLADGVIISHAEGYERGIASGHADPEHLWDGLGMGYTMDGFRKDVKTAMQGSVAGEDKKEGVIRVEVSLVMLRDGSEGENVKALQILLNGRGCSCGTVDGIFGAKTLAAVKKFQRKYDLEVDGIVGINTWTALLE